MTDLRKIRISLIIVFVGLIISGVTAFPLLHELNFLATTLTGGNGDLNPAHYTGITHWILKVRDGLETTYQAYPFIAYGTDWLAFAHLMIALFFILPYRDPQRYLGVLHVGVWMSLLIFPLALICGHIREIPFFWRLIDCSFGVLCLPPLLYAIKLTHRLEQNESHP
ncbi:hypothetical protein V2O64_11525 [Verrucomicrobiaceae bacterium 227]